jgi:hypothetical protein
LTLKNHHKGSQGEVNSGLKEPGLTLRTEVEKSRSTVVDGFLLPPCAERKLSGKQKEIKES